MKENELHLCHLKKKLYKKQRYDPFYSGGAGVESTLRK